MGKGNRPTTCATTNKRLRAKAWYYRDGKYFYNRGAWEQAREKLAQDAATAKAKTEKDAQAAAEASQAAAKAAETKAATESAAPAEGKAEAAAGPDTKPAGE